MQYIQPAWKKKLTLVPVVSGYLALIDKKPSCR